MATNHHPSHLPLTSASAPVTTSRSCPDPRILCTTETISVLRSGVLSIVSVNKVICSLTWETHHCFRSKQKKKTHTPGYCPTILCHIIHFKGDVRGPNGYAGLRDTFVHFRTFGCLASAALKSCKEKEANYIALSEGLYYLLNLNSRLNKAQNKWAHEWVGLVSHGVDRNLSVTRHTPRSIVHQHRFSLSSGLGVTTNYLRST